MACVYIIFSKKLDKFDTGSSKELAPRLDQHLGKEIENSFTTKADDWKLFYSIENLGYDQARKIEQQIKKMKSKTFIRNLTLYPEITEKLKIKYS